MRVVVEDACPAAVDPRRVESAPDAVEVFNAPDCVDCSIYKVRLKANLAANTLIEAGVLSIVSVYPEGQTDGIDGEAANWNVASLPDFDKAYDMRIRPAVYFLDGEKRIVAKFVEIDNLLSTLEGIKQAKGV